MAYRERANAMQRTEQSSNTLLTARPGGIPTPLNYLFLGHLLLWCIVNLFPRWTQSMMESEVGFGLLHASIAGVWIGVGRGVLIQRAAISILVLQLASRPRNYEDVRLEFLLTTTIVSLFFFGSEFFGYRFVFIDKDKAAPQPAKAQFSLMHIFAATTAISVVFAAATAAQELFGYQAGIVIVFLMLDCVVTFALCVTVLSMRRWLSRSSIVLLLAVLTAFVASLVGIGVSTRGFAALLLAPLATSIWLLILFVTFAVLRSSGYRFGRFVTEENTPDFSDVPLEPTGD